MKGGKALVKIQVSAVFHMIGIQRKDWFTQIYRALFWNAISVPMWMGTNMAAGNQQSLFYLTLQLSRPPCKIRVMKKLSIYYTHKMKNPFKVKICITISF